MAFTKAKRSKAGWALLSLVGGLLLRQSHASAAELGGAGRREGASTAIG